jgi:predicted nucleic acid-binding protein
VRRYLLDTNLSIAADRNKEKAEELVRFYAAFLPFTYLHAVVAQDLLAGAVDPKRGRQIQESYIAPFEERNRIITPTYRTWRRSGEVLAALVRRRVFSPDGFARSFINDVLLAVSCREVGMTLLTTNTEDFQRIRQVERFEFVPPWPAV